jgi:hypothetical protein
MPVVRNAEMIQGKPDVWIAGSQATRTLAALHGVLRPRVARPREHGDARDPAAILILLHYVLDRKRLGTSALHGDARLESF